MHLYDLTDPNDIKQDLGDKSMYCGKLLEATVMNNKEKLEDNNTHTVANNSEETSVMGIGAARDSSPYPDFTTQTVRAQVLHSEPPLPVTLLLPIGSWRKNSSLLSKLEWQEVWDSLCPQQTLVQPDNK